MWTRRYLHGMYLLHCLDDFQGRYEPSSEIYRDALPHHLYLLCQQVLPKSEWLHLPLVDHSLA